MNEFERRIRKLITRLSQWLGDSAGATRKRRIEGTAALRQEAAARAQQAAAKARDLRDTDAAKKAASALHDLREHETTKKAEAKSREQVRQESEQEAIQKAGGGGRGGLRGLVRLAPVVRGAPAGRVADGRAALRDRPSPGRGDA